MLKAWKSAYNILKSGCTFNYTSNNNDIRLLKTISALQAKTQATILQLPSL